MMKKRQLLLVLASFGAMTTFSYGRVDYSDPKQRNPQGDQYMEERYNKYQKEYKEKKEAEERKERGVIEKPYEVDRGGVDDANVPYQPQK